MNLTTIRHRPLRETAPRQRITARPSLWFALLLSVLLIVSACSSAADPQEPVQDPDPAPSVTEPAKPAVERHGASRLIPLPVSALATADGQVTIPDSVRIVYADESLAGVAEQFAQLLRTPTGYAVPVVLDLPVPEPPTDAPSAAPEDAAPEDETPTDPTTAPESDPFSIILRVGEPSQTGPDAYDFKIAETEILILVSEPAAAFRALQTLRQLLPAEIESSSPVPSFNWTLDPVEIQDAARYEYRGVMLDVTRRFAQVDEVKRFIDHAALYKFNYVHLHLSDDSGWRFEVPQYPELVDIGSQTQAGHPPGSRPDAERWHYTPEELRDITAYAQERYITLVPESDGPGHTLAAQASLGMLRCDGKRGEPYFGYDVNHPMVCAEPENEDNLRAYLEAVIAALVDQTDSPIIHLGGDEVPNPPEGWYELYTKIAREVLAKHDRTLMAWHQWAGGEGIMPGDIMQFWVPDAGWSQSIGTAVEPLDIQLIRNAVEQGAKVVLSPADRLYLDMRYDQAQDLGLQWAARSVTVRAAYDWDPDLLLINASTGDEAVPATEILGIEAPLWTDRTYRNSLLHLADDLSVFIPLNEYVDEMAFPRLPAAAEVAWTAQTERHYEDFEVRLVGHTPRWERLGIQWYRAAEIPWGDG